jgi:hypothetical protein
MLMLTWRWDIRLLELAAKSSCRLCATDITLAEPRSHESERGVKVFCVAFAINLLMGERVYLTREKTEIERRDDVDDDRPWWEKALDK